MTTGSLVNMVMGGSKQPAPVLGMGVTILMWTDRHAATVIQVLGKRVVVQRDHAKLVSGSCQSESQQYEFSPNPSARPEAFTLRKNGAWVAQGTPMRSGTRILLGHREEYRDPSF